MRQTEGRTLAEIQITRIERKSEYGRAFENKREIRIERAETARAFFCLSPLAKNALLDFNRSPIKLNIPNAISPLWEQSQEKWAPPIRQQKNVLHARFENRLSSPLFFPQPLSHTKILVHLNSGREWDCQATPPPPPSGVFK